MNDWKIWEWAAANLFIVLAAVMICAGALLSAIITVKQEVQTRIETIQEEIPAVIYEDYVDNE